MCDREKDALSPWIMSLCCDFHHLLLSLLLVLLFVRWAGKSRTVWKPKQLKDILYVYWKAAFARWGEDCGRHCNRLNICVLFMSLYCPARLPLKAKQYCLAFNKCNYFIIAAVKALSDMDIISATQPNTHTHTPHPNDQSALVLCLDEWCLPTSEAETTGRWECGEEGDDRWTSLCNFHQGFHSLLCFHKWYQGTA